MKKLSQQILCLLVLLVSVLSHRGFTEVLVKSGDLVAVVGDSITEQKLYSVFIEDYIQMCAPIDDMKVAQFGWGGERASGFLSRMDNDAMTFSPAVLTTCYGMNDGNYAPVNDGTKKSYYDSMAKIVQNCKQKGVRVVIVGSPGVVDTATFKRPNATADVYNETLAALGEMGKKVAEEQGVVFADLHTVMMNVMQKAKAAKGENYAVAGGDGVHPGPNGHIVMAYAFLKAMGFDGNIETITYDAASGKAEAEKGSKVVSSKVSEIQLESTRFPFCFTGTTDSTNSNETAGILPFVPFNEDLNRYTLIVKNLKAPKAKVTWGEESKEFTADQLAKGINLAAEFLKNPFVPAFQAMDKEISAKQLFETVYIKNYLNSRKGYIQIVPELKDDFKGIDDKFREMHKSKLSAILGMKKPVSHTIKIEEVK